MEISENQCLNLLYTDACMIVNQQFENSSLYGANVFIYQPPIESELQQTPFLCSHTHYRIHYLMASKVLRNLKAIYLADSYCMKQSE